MPHHRANATNVNTNNANAASPVPDQEVSYAKFRNDIHMLTQSMANHNNGVHAPVNTNGGSAAVSVNNFVRMNSPEFLASQNNEIPKIS